MISLGDRDEAGNKIAKDAYDAPLTKYGYATWKDYVESSMDRALPKAYRNGKIFGKVAIAFEVDKDGSITNVRVFKSSGYVQLDEHAMNIIRNSPPRSNLREHGRIMNGNMIQQFNYPLIKEPPLGEE